MDNLNNEQTEKYKSVGGWLLLLCISLTILSPLRTLYQTVTNLLTISLYLNELEQSIKLYLYLSTFLEVIIVSLGFKAGIALWEIKQGALKIAKIFFKVFFYYTIISFAIPHVFGFSGYVNDIKSTIGNLLYIFIWYSYLGASIRVIKTYK